MSVQKLLNKVVLKPKKKRAPVNMGAAPLLALLKESTIDIPGMKRTKNPLSTAFVALFLVCATAGLQALVPARGQSGVQVTVNDVGLQSLTYNGLNYMYQSAAQTSGGTLVDSTLFQAPDGTIKPYGWEQNSLIRGPLPLSAHPLEAPAPILPPFSKFIARGWLTASRLK